MWIKDIPPILFMLAFAALWCGICYLLAVIGGWSSLANFYHLNEPFDGQKWHFRSAQFRYFANYNNALTLGASERGLYMAVLFLFRFGHPPLLVPWQHVRKAPRGVFSFWSTPLLLGEHSPVRVSVSSRLVEKFEVIARQPIKAVDDY